MGAKGLARGRSHAIRPWPDQEAYEGKDGAANETLHPCLRVELRGPAAKVSWLIFCSGRLFGCLENQNGHKQLGMERTTTSSLVPFQPFQPGRNKFRRAPRYSVSAGWNVKPGPLWFLINDRSSQFRSPSQKTS